MIEEIEPNLQEMQKLAGIKTRLDIIRSLTKKYTEKVKEYIKKVMERRNILCIDINELDNTYNEIEAPVILDATLDQIYIDDGVIIVTFSNTEYNGCRTIDQLTPDVLDDILLTFQNIIEDYDNENYRLDENHQLIPAEE